MFDLVIKGGTLIDGTGTPGRVGDLAVKDGKIVAVGGNITGPAKETLDATGKLVTPGFIDGHTHYDAQVSWDTVLEPSFSHGVTTAVMGNCGVGFAPVHTKDHAQLIDLMEGVEDIPGTALYEGIKWGWNSFPEYLDVIGRSHFALDVAAQVPHAPLRLYVMGQRGADNEPATREDIVAMSKLATEALKAGAIGVSTSRVLEHQAASGAPVPGTYAAEDEVMALAGAVRVAGRGVLQVVPGGAVGAMSIPESADLLPKEIDLLTKVATETKVPVVFSLMQAHDEPEAWRKAVAAAEQVRQSGGRMNPMVSPRATGAFSSWASYHVFQRREAYMKIAHLPLAQRLVELRKPEVKAAILASRDIAADVDTIMSNYHVMLRRRLHTYYVYDESVDFEPKTGQTLGEIAKARGEDIESCAYDALMAKDGYAMLFCIPINYAAGDYSVVGEMLASPNTVAGLSDAGAHVRVICDASNTTFALTFWCRDRKRGDRLPLEVLIRKFSADLADAFGFHDRGRLAVGLRADINVIDFNKMELGHPEVVADLPRGGERILQGAKGYVMTVVNGVITRRDDKDTGARPGRLVRNAGVHTRSARSAA